MMFGNNRMKLEDYKNRYYYGRCVYKIDKPHQAIKYDRPIEVWFEDIRDDGRESRFLLFDDGEFVTNTLTLPCKIEFEDIEKIAKDLVDELLSMSDFEDLDSELDGKCACGEFEDIYKSCDECPRYNKEQSEDDGCLGAMYSIPTHANTWDKTEKKWNKVYGYDSNNYKEYKLKLVEDAIRDTRRAIHGDGEYIKRFKSVLKDALKGL